MEGATTGSASAGASAEATVLDDAETTGGTGLLEEPQAFQHSWAWWPG